MSLTRVGYLVKSVAYTDTTSISMGTIGANAVVTDVKVLVNTAFDSGTSNVFDVGISGTSNNLAASVDVTSSGPASVTGTATWGSIQSTSAPAEVTVLHTPTGAAATAGSAKVVVEYVYVED